MYSSVIIARKSLLSLKTHVSVGALLIIKHLSYPYPYPILASLHLHSMLFTFLSPEILSFHQNFTKSIENLLSILKQICMSVNWRIPL